MQKPPLNRTMKGRASSMRRKMTKEEFHLWYHFLRLFSWEVFLSKAFQTMIGPSDQCPLRGKGGAEGTKGGAFPRAKRGCMVF